MSSSRERELFKQKAIAAPGIIAACHSELSASSSSLFAFEWAHNNKMAAKLDCIALFLFFFVSFRCCSASDICGDRFGAVRDGVESDFAVLSAHVSILHCHIVHNFLLHAGNHSSQASSILKQQLSGKHCTEPTCATDSVTL